MTRHAKYSPLAAMKPWPPGTYSPAPFRRSDPDGEPARRSDEDTEPDRLDDAPLPGSAAPASRFQGG